MASVDPDAPLEGLDSDDDGQDAPRPFDDLYVVAILIAMPVLALFATAVALGWP